MGRWWLPRVEGATSVMAAVVQEVFLQGMPGEPGSRGRVFRADLVLWPPTVVVGVMPVLAEVLEGQGRTLTVLSIVILRFWVAKASNPTSRGHCAGMRQAETARGTTFSAGGATSGAGWRD